MRTMAIVLSLDNHNSYIVIFYDNYKFVTFDTQEKLFCMGSGLGFINTNFLLLDKILVSICTATRE
jgi:hypothetical protein